MSRLPDILSRSGPLSAHEAEDGDEMRAGRIYVAKPDHHLLVDKTRISVKKGPKENRFRPSIDALESHRFHEKARETEKRAHTLQGLSIRHEHLSQDALREPLDHAQTHSGLSKKP